MTNIGYRSIDSAQFVEDGQVALLAMPCGCIHKCVWEQRGGAVAWWPHNAEGGWIALYSPVAWLPLFNEREARVQ